MRHSLKTGFSFGLTSAIITTLGLMVGLHSGTHSRLAVIGGVLTVAVADAFSDALGIHIAEEAEDKHTHLEVWESTIATFVTKFFFAITFIIPVLLLALHAAIIVSVIWGLLLLGVLSVHIARSQNAPVIRVLAEHLTIAIILIITTHYTGEWISSTFG